MRHLFFVILIDLAIALPAKIYAAEGSVQSSVSEPWLHLKMEGDSAREIFEHIQKAPEGDYSHAREIKDAEGRNTLCSYDGKLTENAWCTGTMLAAEVRGGDAVVLFEKLPTYGAMYRFGELESIWRPTFYCKRISLRSDGLANLVTHQCDTSVAINGNLKAKRPAMVGVLN